MEVKSVYNFVPAPKEKEVFTPDWANKVSHDLPFEDGESGEIELTITAKTPVFIRNGHSKQDAEEKTERYLEFSNVERNGKKEYFIPGSSLKGMFRNVLEMLSFSRLKTANDIFSYRDMASRNSRFKTEVATNKDLKTGWLENVNGNWVISECNVGRVSIKDIEHKYRVKFKDLTAFEKYQSIKQNILNFSFNEVKELGLTIRGKFIKTGTLYDFGERGKFKGDLVFFGSMNNKKYEYIFTTPIGEKYSVDKNLIKRFEDIDKKLNDTQWQYLNSNKNPYPNKRIPVFFKEKNDKVEHFGFSRLYKMSNTHYLKELEPLKSYPDRKKEYEFDLAETIFGTTNESLKLNEKSQRETRSLKGRVFIGHAFTKEEVKPNKPVKVVMASPKASYYPFYLEENKTYLDDDATLRGFKKYPVHTKTKDSSLNEENTEIETKITPLPEGVIFTSKIRYFNLKRVELGALLSAITLHKNEHILSHNIGSAKPLGFGKISIDIKDNYDEYIAEFEDFITLNLKQKGIDWLKSDSLKELFAMAKDPLKEANLKYPQLELLDDKGNKVKDKKGKPINEFNNFIKEGLKPYSSGINNGFISIKKKFEEEKQKNVLIEKEKEKVKNLLNKAKDNFKQGKYVEAKEIFEKLLTVEKVYIKEDLDLINKRIDDCKKELDKIQDKYNELIAKADDFFKHEKWQEAKGIYLDAKEIKEDHEINHKINNCDEKLILNQDLSILEGYNNYYKGRDAINIYKKENSIDKSQYRFIENFINKHYKPTDREWKNFKRGKRWKEVIGWVGKDIAQEWHEKLNIKND